MTKRMLIDSTHAEETRVVVLDGNRLEDYDVETSTKQQLKGNIYLAKIVRVEPSLQAAFVEFGGGRHGFLAFGEIHPDYYQIPVADRKRLLDMQEAEAREEEEAEEREAARQERGGRNPAPAPENLEESHEDVPEDDDAAASIHPDAIAAAIAQDIITGPEQAAVLFPETLFQDPETAEPAAPEQVEPTAEHPAENAPEETDSTESEPTETASSQESSSLEVVPPNAEPEHIGGELDTDDRQDRRTTPRFLRNYKIQEVMRRRQILLVQVVKEERGNKGAALTTYISLAGRFSVLMPNSPRGGGISRKITSAADRRRLKEITAELDLPRGMGLIVRTAGANRPKPEIIRDCEYLLSQWDQIRDLTMKSMAPTLIYEEASLIKRAIRDVYSREVEEILVDGEDGWRAARDFMRMLMPGHAKKVQLWRDIQPLFAKAQVENQLDAMLQPTVQLRSGGYLVINQTEALVAIDVNSGRSTRERGIEETAFRTNLEAAEETARQLRLRDLAGLIVIDFIDMESRRNNTAVEKKLKDALKNDRARIQVGSISHFGLLEMSRQRLRPSLAETSFIPCVHCGGTGHMRSTESAALAVLRGIEEEGSKRRAAEIVVHVHGSIALYVLNHKRLRLGEIEQRFGMHVVFQADDSMIPPQMRIEKIRALMASDGPMPISQLPPPEPFDDPDEEVMEADPVETEATHQAPESTESAPESVAQTSSEPTTGSDDEPDRPGETAEEGEQRRRKRRRRRRGGRREETQSVEGQSAEGQSVEGATPGSENPEAQPNDGAAIEPPIGDAAPDGAQPEGEASDPANPLDGEKKRRGRRGGRRRRRDPEGEAAPSESGEPTPESDEAPAPVRSYAPAPQPIPAPVITYTGPTPANPFGGDSNAFAFFDAVEEIDDEPIRPTPRQQQPAPTPISATVSASVPAPAPQPEPTPAAAEPETPTARIEAPLAEQPVEPTPDPAQPAPIPPAPAPAIIPIDVGATEAPPAEKKKGWWRR